MREQRHRVVREDGVWVAESEVLPGIAVKGKTRDEAVAFLREAEALFRRMWCNTPELAAK
jgi:predicted RNase H-like HicB family nuclease